MSSPDLNSGKEREVIVLRSSEEARLPKMEAADAKVVVPTTLRSDGIYSLQVSQGEMYDLVKFKFITHYIILDLKNRIAVDVTANIKQAALLSAVPRGTIVSPDGVDRLERWLKREEIPQYILDNPEGVREFVAAEITSMDNGELRRSIQVLADSRMAYDRATVDFEKLFGAISGKVVQATELANAEQTGLPRPQK